MIRVGGSPRATICLVRASKARAFLAGRDFVSPDDVKELAHEHEVVLHNTNGKC